MSHSIPLLADAGIPMIVLTFPAMAILLLPIVVTEGLLCKKWLALTTWEAIKSNAVANIASTVVGVPFAWAIMLMFEFGVVGLVDSHPSLQNSHSPLLHLILFFLSSAWIGPPEESLWMVPCAVLALLIPFFLISYRIEYFLVNQMVGMPDGDPSNRTSRRIRMAVRNANLITYGAMFIATTTWLIAALLRHWLF